MNQATLKLQFEKIEPEFRSQLSALTLPKDSNKVQNIIKDYLDKLLDEKGEYRLMLTQSEDYLLQSALYLLNSQNDIVNFCGEGDRQTEEPKVETTNNTKSSSEPNNSDTPAHKTIETKNVTVNPTNTLIATGGGAIVGRMLLSSWGGVIGALTGAAIYLYKESIKKVKVNENCHLEEGNISKGETLPIKKIDTDLLVTIIEKICDNIDNLMATYRAQIRRVVDKYENQEKPTLEKNFRMLLESIQALIGYNRLHSSDEKFVWKIQERIEDVSESLENYNLTVEDYTEDHESWFELIPSKNTDVIKMVYPAIVKDGTVVIKGKAFIPEK